MQLLPIQRKVEGSNRYPWTLRFVIVAYVLLDDEDFEWAKQWRWGDDGHGYPSRHERLNGQISIYLHQEIALRAGLTWDWPNTIDHCDRNSQNYQRNNLRVATRSEQMINQGLQKRSASGLKGVFWNKQTGKWRAQIKFQGKTTHLGRFDTKQDAVVAYQKAAERRDQDILYDKWVTRMEAEWGEPAREARSGWWIFNCWLCQSDGSTLVNYRAVIPPGFPKSRKRDLLAILTVAGFPKLP